mmetsp:Transcript_5798/g.21932  ORF Transcript_5798/g.21932 Transcript_5798/m.21932 type:complete len:205 (+) Transcript_5798:12037-12651(+)
MHSLNCSLSQGLLCVDLLLKNSVIMFLLRLWSKYRRRCTLGLSQLFPLHVSVENNLHCEFSVHCTSIQSIGVLLLSCANFVLSKVLTNCIEQSWKLSVYIINVVEQVSHWVIDADRNVLPIGLSIINERDHSQKFHWYNCSNRNLASSNLNHINWIIVSWASSLWRNMGRILKGLRKHSIIPAEISVLVKTNPPISHVLLDWVV